MQDQIVKIFEQFDRTGSSIRQVSARSDARPQAFPPSRNDDRRHRTHASDPEGSVQTRSTGRQGQHGSQDLECGSRCVIQRNFPAPAWLDLKTFAPQPLSVCPLRWQVHRLRCPDDAGSRLLLFPRRSRTPTAFIQRSRFSSGSQNLNPNHSHSARLVQNAAFGFPFDSYCAFSHQVGRSPSSRRDARVPASHQSPAPGFGKKNWNLSGFPFQSLESGGGGFFIVMFGQTFTNSAFSRNHFSSPGSVSGLIASTGHSGTQTPQSMHSSGWITSMFSPS